MDIALMAALLMMLGVGCQWVAWRLNLPAILPLLLAGLVLGPGLHVLDPDSLLGDLLFPMVSLGVAIILFEGSLTLRFSDIRNVQRIIRNLTSIGVLVTIGVMAAAAHYIGGLEWPLSFLFGALVSVTGPTVVAPMLRSIKPTSRISSILRWEGILVDPIGAVLAVLILEFILSGYRSDESLAEFIKVIALGTVWGIAGGWAMGRMLKHHLFPEYLVNFASLALVLLVFTSSNALGEESGLVAVVVMGMVMANNREISVDDLLSFKEHLTVVAISLLFILLAARLNFDLVQQIWPAALLILLVILFVARPLSVLLSSIGTSLEKKEIALLAWVAPRGIVAAAISSLFAIKLSKPDQNIPTEVVMQADQLVPLTFVMIIGTVLVQSLTAGWLARRLGLSSQGDQGVLVTGSNKVSLALGEALHENGVKVMVVDNRRDGLKEARMLGFSTFYGNPVSEHAQRYMDLTGYTHLLAMSRNAEANAVVCRRYRHEFGVRNVYSVQSGTAAESDERHGLAMGLRTRTLFGQDVTWSKLASLLAQGAEFRATRMSEEFDFQAWQANWGKTAIAMFALDADGDLRFFTADEELMPDEGWLVISLVNPESEGHHNRGNGHHKQQKNGGNGNGNGNGD